MNARIVVWMFVNWYATALEAAKELYEISNFRIFNFELIEQWGNIRGYSMINAVQGKLQAGTGCDGKLLGVDSAPFSLVESTEVAVCVLARSLYSLISGFPVFRSYFCNEINIVTNGKPGIGNLSINNQGKQAAICGYSSV